MAVCLLVGVPAGLIAGYYNNAVSHLIMRMADIFLAVPRIILALAIAQALGSSLPNLILALAVTYWPWFTVIVAAETRAVKQSTFVEATETLGAGPLRTMACHKARFDLTYLFIAHDLGIIRLMCDRVAVMYLGAIVEMGPTAAIFQSPTHPYTQALLAAVPKAEIDPWQGTLLQGEPPRPDALPAGCRFRLRCPLGQDTLCAQIEPTLIEVANGHRVACHLAPGAAKVTPDQAA